MNTQAEVMQLLLITIRVRVRVRVSVLLLLIILIIIIMMIIIIVWHGPFVMNTQAEVIIFMMACALRSSPSQSLSIEGGNLLPPATKPPKGGSSRWDRVT
jgi:hypothetical protein